MYSIISYIFISESFYWILESSNHGCWLFPVTNSLHILVELQKKLKCHQLSSPMASKTKQSFSLYLPQCSLSTLLELGQLKIEKATMSDTTLSNLYYQVQIARIVSCYPKYRKPKSCKTFIFKIYLNRNTSLTTCSC